MMKAPHVNLNKVGEGLKQVAYVAAPFVAQVAIGEAVSMAVTASMPQIQMPEIKPPVDHTAQTV
jgi:hypothetical protein